MKISIAMATYNGSKYLKAQLQSFVDQTRQPDELIIIDDCSTDGTELIIRDFAKGAPFKVKFHRNENNLGYSGNFNAALLKTSGDLVFLSDQDDVWFGEKIEHILLVANQNPSALLFMNDAALTDADLNEVDLTKIGQIRSAGFPLDDFVMGCCCAVRRELLDFCIPMPDGLKGHDSWLVGVAQAIGGKFVDERVLQYYRRHGANESRFIANRTSKVTPLDVVLNRVGKLLDKDARREEALAIEQMRLFAKGVREVTDRAPEIYRHQLSEFLSITEANIQTFANRLEIREKWLLERIFAATRMFMNNGYRNTSGFTSLLRDILG